MTDLHEGQSASGENTPNLNEDQQQALTLLTEICAASGLEVSPVVRGVNPPYMNIELVGSDAAVTFGRLGQSLDALQFLGNLILSHRVRSDVRLLLDAAQYRERRVAALSSRALEIAKEVKARNEEAELEPLPAHERRIIHAALADDPDIMTYSEGEEPDRRIVISPRR